MTTISSLRYDFSKDLTDEPVYEFPSSIFSEALPHEPLRDWQTKNKWINFYWLDDLIPLTVEGLEDTAFTPLNFSEFSQEVLSKLMKQL